MRERPILFSGAMVRALIDRSKTQTRRLVKPQPHLAVSSIEHVEGAEFRFCAPERVKQQYAHTFPLHRLRCPYGAPGDRLWVRETFALVPATAYRASAGVNQTVNPSDTHESAIYRACFDRASGGVVWKPSIHMPRWASRLTLKVTDVRVERLRDISEEDARAEGCHDSDGAPTQELSGTARGAYALLWDEINGKTAKWSSNPWVWAITFEVIAP